MSVARAEHTATSLSSGSVLVAGGLESGDISIGSAELYDPAAGAFTTTSNMTARRNGHTASLLGNGTVLIAGGRIDGTKDLASAELYQ
jgi:hypothetical protein